MQESQRLKCRRDPLIPSYLQTDGKYPEGPSSSPKYDLQQDETKFDSCRDARALGRTSHDQGMAVDSEMTASNLRLLLNELESIVPVRSKLRNLFSDRGFSEILTGSVYTIVARIAATGLGFVTTMLVARYYGAETLGVLAVITSFLTLTTVFTLLGTSTSILRLIPEHIANYSTASAFQVYRKTQYLVLALSVLVGCALYLLSGVIAEQVFSKPELAFFFALAAIFVAFKSLMQLNTEAVRALRLIKTFAFMQILPGLAMILLLVAGMLFVTDGNLPVYAQLAAWALTALAGIWIMDRSFKKRSNSTAAVHSMPLGSLLRLSLPMLLSATMTIVIAQTGVIILGIFHNEAQVGYYFLAVKLSTITILILTAINSMAAPKFSELFHTGQTDEVFRVAKKATRLIFWATVPILLGLIVLGKPVIGLAFGPDFTAAYVPMVFLLCGQFVNAISGSTGIFMNMTGHQGAFRNIMAISAALNLTLNFALIPNYGPLGAAVAAAITVAFWNIVTLLYIKGLYGRTIGYFPFVG